MPSLFRSGRRFFFGVLLAVLALPLLSSGGSAADAPKEIAGVTTLDANGVIALIEKQPTLVILDNRREGDFKDGHIEGAIRLIDDDMTGPEVLAKYVPAKTTPVLFYCNGPKCGRAANAARLAIQWGYGAVSYYYGGMEDWKGLGLPLTKS